MQDLLELIDGEEYKKLISIAPELQRIVSGIEEVNKAGKTINFAGASNLAKLQESLEKAEQTTKRMKDTEAEYTSVVMSQAEKRQRAIEVANARAEKSEIARVEAAVKGAEREQKAMAKLNNEYEQLKAQYKAASDEAKRLGVVAENLSATIGKQSAAYKLAAGNAASAAKFSMGLYESLLKVEKSVGQAQRQVGQYNTAAFAMSQILRETPAFAYSAATGFLAMSNNIPILVDEINKLRAANALLKAEGAATIPIWKTLASSIFSFNGLLTLGIAAITIYTARMGMHKSTLSETERIAKKYDDTLKSIDETQTKSAVTEQARIASLLAIAKNTQVAMDIRLRVIRSLQEQYPDYLGNIEKEKFLTGELTGAVEKLNTALMQRGLMQATTEKVGAAYTKIIDAESEILKIDKERFEWTEKQLKLDKNAQFGAASFRPFEVRQSFFRKQIADAMPRLEGRRKVLWVCVDIKHAELVRSLIPEESAIMHSKNYNNQFNEECFERGNVRHMVSVSMLAEGYDYPKIDAIAIVRPTRSPRLYVQIVGRGLRLSEGKRDCLILDYGQVIKHLGSISNPKVVESRGSNKEAMKIDIRVCQNCFSSYPIELDACPDCHFEIPDRDKEKNLRTKAFDGEMLSEETEWDVLDVEIKQHISKNGNQCIRIDYIVENKMWPISDYLMDNKFSKWREVK